MVFDEFEDFVDFRFGPFHMGKLDAQKLLLWASGLTNLVSEFF